MTILKLIFVILLLVAMVVILLGIGHLSNGRFETDHTDIDKLREEVDNSDQVISRRNMFYEFLVSARRRGMPRR